MYMNFGMIRFNAFPLIRILMFSALGLFSLTDVFSADTLPTYMPISVCPDEHAASIFSDGGI